jgi:hypothetical protein
MKSKKSSRLLDLDRDLPTTAVDICALRQARMDGIQDLKSYFDFLSCFSEPSTPPLSERKGPAGSKPFEL